MFPTIFVTAMVGTLTLMTASLITEEVNANISRRILATYLKRMKRRRKMA